MEMNTGFLIHLSVRFTTPFRSVMLRWSDDEQAYTLFLCFSNPSILRLNKAYNRNIAERAPIFAEDEKHRVIHTDIHSVA